MFFTNAFKLGRSIRFAVTVICADNISARIKVSDNQIVHNYIVSLAVVSHAVLDANSAVSFVHFLEPGCQRTFVRVRYVGTVAVSIEDCCEYRGRLKKWLFKLDSHAQSIIISCSWYLALGKYKLM